MPITAIPMGDATTLTWIGGHENNDPTVAANWNPGVAPKMAADQILLIKQGTMNLNDGNLQANQLNVDTGHDHTATINLTAGGTLDLNVPNGAEAHAHVNLSGGGEVVTNLFSGPTGNPDVTISIDSSKLDLQANLTFGKLCVNGNGMTYLQGDSQLNGMQVTLNTKLAGFGSMEIGAAGSTAGHLELKDTVPSGLTINVLDHAGATHANGVQLDTWSTTPGGPITLQNAFADVAKEATSYLQNGNEIDLFNNGTKFDSLNIAAAPGSGPLNVGVANGQTYIYNASASSIIPSSGSSGGSMPLVASNLITALPMHG